MAIPQNCACNSANTLTLDDTTINIPFQNLLRMFESAISITASQTITDASGASTPDGKNWYFKSLTTKWDNSTDASTILTLAENSSGDEQTQDIELRNGDYFVFNILTNELTYSYVDADENTHLLSFTFYDEVELSTDVLVKYGAITQ